MINIAQTNPAVWSPPASTATAPVAAVSAIRPSQESRNGQSGSREQETPSARASRRADARETARQGRDAAGESARGVAGRAGATGAESIDARVRREAEQNTKQLATEQAAEEARRAQRQELLTNVWKASAAVVDQVLGRDDATAVKSASESRAASDSQPSMEQLALPWPVMPQDARATPSRADLGVPEDVVAYDELGNGNLAPLEVGMLISHRV
jgi:hypothetical protein